MRFLIRPKKKLKNIKTTERVVKSIEDTEKYNKYAEKNRRDKEYNVKVDLQNQFDYYFVVYFDDDKEKNEFCRQNNLDYDFVYGKDLIKKIKEC